MRVLLAVLLFALQGAALAHESTHAPATDARDCVVCPLSTQPAAPAPDAPGVAPDSPAEALEPAGRLPLAATRPPGFAEARAPPLLPVS